MSNNEKTAILKEILGSFSRTGDELLFSCPKCDHHKRKLSVNVDKDVGKTYISPKGEEWQVSGYYRRNASDEWHPWLMSLDKDKSLTGLSMQDSSNLFSKEVLENSMITIRSID